MDEVSRETTQVRILIALLLLLLAGGVWLALKDGEGQGRRQERTGSALPEAEPERKLPLEVEAETSPVEAPEAVPLRGKIVMDHGRALLEVRAHVTRHGISEEVVRGEAQANLPFEIDVARLLAKSVSGQGRARLSGHTAEVERSAAEHCPVTTGSRRWP